MNDVQTMARHGDEGGLHGIGERIVDVVTYGICWRGGRSRSQVAGQGGMLMRRSVRGHDGGVMLELEQHLTHALEVRAALRHLG
jgi:hypothetical protein